MAKTSNKLPLSGLERVGFGLYGPLRFRVRTLLLAIAVLALVCLPAARKFVQVRRQRSAVAEVQRLRGSVQYDWQYSYPAGFADRSQSAPSGPAWLRSWLGDDFFSHVTFVQFGVTDVPPLGPDRYTCLASFPQLLSLNCGRTDFTAQDVHVLGSLPHLKSFMMHRGQQLTDAEMAVFAQLPSLESLRIHGSVTKITNAGLFQLKGKTSLRVLGLEGAEITDEGLLAVADMTNLRSLGLSKSKVTSAGLRHLSNLHRLYVLSLDNTAVDDHGMEYIAGLRQLELLHLSGTQVTNAGLAKLSALPYRGSPEGQTPLFIDVRNTKVDADGVDRFKHARPDVDVKYK